MKITLVVFNIYITGKNKYNPISVIPIVASASFAIVIFDNFIGLNQQLMELLWFQLLLQSWGNPCLGVFASLLCEITCFCVWILHSFFRLYVLLLLLMRYPLLVKFEIQKFCLLFHSFWLWLLLHLLVCLRLLPLLYIYH